ncbi:VWA domain-containing protein [Pseudonocardia sp. N23]|uniref:vWA domain-containing protein n=1 Tax=Pseudonocardia sp. N23 TaxID=1987376 RepID=UPI000C034682|nr:vWA domain-containing protein [Pseudonocardia sp. N23]GAY07230.1 ATPase associated with various cellular activities, AAA_5 [Pseudonocardia sp. N23]
MLVTGQQARRRALDDLLEEAPADDEVAAMARRIARSLTVRRRPRVRRGDRGSGRMMPMAYRYRSDDIDIDRTVEVLAERPRPDDTEIIVRERVRARRAVVLVADVSGSMRGEKARIAAATIAALSADLSGAGVDDQIALVAFWSDAALLKSFDARLPVGHIVDRLLRIPARGLTNVSFGLEVARAELARSPLRRRSIVLLSDVVHNAGPDPRIVAARCGELHVMLETDGEHDAPLAAELARKGRGRLAHIATHRDVAPALNRLLAD